MAGAGHKSQTLRTAPLPLLQPRTSLPPQRLDQSRTRTLSTIAGHRAALHPCQHGARKCPPHGELATALIYTTQIRKAPQKVRKREINVDDCLIASSICSDKPCS